MSARRGACPGLAEPMATGDGLLARFAVARAVPLDAFATLCAGAQMHGNGIIEITSRGSIQVRGLTPASAPTFAAAVAALDIADPADGRVIANPLAGLDPDELFDARDIANQLRAALVQTGLATALAPKVSIVIDGGGSLNLDAIPADIRLRAESTRDGVVLHVSLAGTPFRTIAPGDATDTVIDLLQTIATLGPTARARDTLPPSPGAGSGSGASEPIGIHLLRDGSVVVGIGLPFGHTDTETLLTLIKEARTFGAKSMRPAPGRVLLVISVAREQTKALADTAEGLGFIINPDDPRRRVVACAGAPVCAAGEIPARALAPAIAAPARLLLEGGATIHISGCAKGCAHAKPAALTIVGIDGRCGVVHDGTARDVPREIIEPRELPAYLAALLEPVRG